MMGVSCRKTADNWIGELRVFPPQGGVLKSQRIVPWTRRFKTKHGKFITSRFRLPAQGRGPNNGLLVKLFSLRVYICYNPDLYLLISPPD